MSRPGWTHAPDPPGGARGVALQVVSRTFDEGAYTDRAFRAAAADLDRRDRALAMEIAYGTVRQRRLLDHGIELLGGRSVGDLDPPVRSALRIGAYQLAFLDSVPAHAAVNEAVELVRRCGLERAVPLTNAVMRKLAGGLERLIGTLGTGSAPAAALRYSYPDWIARAWWEQLGAAAACSLMEAQNRAAEIAVRVNTRKTDEL
ncbi:MAG: transcription antitermination factor NusB, partial [Gaiellales bacterium]